MLSFGLGLSRIMRWRTVSAAEATAGHHDTAVILVWLTGGLSHMDTYDLKPEAPSEYRGDFSPIRTNVSGIEVGELLPMHAQIADKFSLIRSVSHGYADHDGAQANPHGTNSQVAAGLRQRRPLRRLHRQQSS